MVDIPEIVVTNPLLIKAIEAADKAISGIEEGTLERHEINGMLGAGRMYQNAVKTQLQLQLGALKIMGQQMRLDKQIAAHERQQHRRGG